MLKATGPNSSQTLHENIQIANLTPSRNHILPPLMTQKTNQNKAKAAGLLLNEQGNPESRNSASKLIGMSTMALTPSRPLVSCKCKTEITSLKNQLEHLKIEYENLQELSSYLRYRAYKIDVQNHELR